jgi:DNA-(apurinic or apyrimidinic site) lyase
MGFEPLFETLREFTLEDAFKVEKNDRQYQALERLYKSLKEKELFFKLVLTNALLSYQLSMKGERYWETFAEYFSDGKTLKDFGEFLKKYNNRFLNGKLKRFEKISKLFEGLTLNDFKNFCENPEELLNFLSRGLNQKRDAKTLVFAVKMFIYACRIAGFKHAVAPFGMDIPLDVRLQKISADRTFWKKLAEEVGIPPLHLDAIIWTTMGASEKDLETLDDRVLKEKLKKLKKVLDNLVRKG